MPYTDRMVRSICFLTIYFVFLLLDIHANTIVLDKHDDEITSTPTTLYSIPDSSTVLLKSNYDKAKKENDHATMIISLLELAKINRFGNQYDQALGYSSEAFTLAKELKDTLLLVDAFTSFGIINNVFFQQDLAESSLKEAVRLLKVLNKQGKVKPDRLVTSYFNLLLFSKRFDRYNDALVYLDSCYLISDTISASLDNIAYLDNEKGFLLLNQKRLDEAMLYLIKSAKVFEGIEGGDEPLAKKSYLAVIYSYIAEVYRQKESYKESAQYFEQSLDLIEQYPTHVGHKPYILEHYGWLLYELGEYERALKYLNESHLLIENNFSAKTHTQNDFLAIHSKYQSAFSKKTQELILKNSEIERKDKAILRFRIFTFSFLVMLLLGLLIWKIRHTGRQHREERKAISIKQLQVKEQIKLKNKELTVFTLKLIEKDEIIKQLSMELGIHKSSNSETVLSHIERKSISLWDDFNSRFMAVNEDFYDKLNASVPGLSANDLKICALIKLNFSSKEMAHLLGISLDSVQKARHRVRKKLNIDRTVNFTSFISSI